MESAGENIVCKTVLVKNRQQNSSLLQPFSAHSKYFQVPTTRQLFARFAYVPLCFICYVRMGSFYSWLVRNNF